MVLAHFPTQAPHVLTELGGENAGAVDIGDGWVVVWHQPPKGALFFIWCRLEDSNPRPILQIINRSRLVHSPHGLQQETQ